jgi:hypothetical protein
MVINVVYREEVKRRYCREEKDDKKWGDLSASLSSVAALVGWLQPMA